MNSTDTGFECSSGGSAARGFVLFAALIFLLVLSLIGVAMFSDVGLQQRMAGDLQQKLRALTAANAALAVAENYLATDPASAQAECTGLVTASRVCPYGSMDDPARDAVWTGAAAVAVQLTGADFAGTVALAGGIEGAYAAFPEYYIEQVPNLPWLADEASRFGPTAQDASAALYRISAWGVGGNPGAVAVVQAVFFRPAPAATRAAATAELSWAEIR